MEHFYQNIGEPWFCSEELYKLAVEKFGDNTHFVEIGAWKGRSASFMAVEIINSNKNIKFDVIDTWTGSSEHHHFSSIRQNTLYDEFMKNTESVSHIINPLRMTSKEASTLYEDQSLDFVFIDASHDYQSVKEDILLWLPKVKKGGIISGDDYIDGWPGVVQAVNEVFDQSVKVMGRQSWIVEK